MQPTIQQSKQLDTSIDIVTPENIVFSYLLAGPFRRVSAFLTDCLIIVGILFLLGVSLGLLTIYLPIPGGLVAGIMLLAMFILSWFYGAFFETVWNGQTPGKWSAGLRVLTTDGQPINSFQAFLRNVLRLADLQPVGTGLLGLTVTAMNDRFQRLGDIAAGTMVVVEDKSFDYRHLPRFDHPEVARLVSLIPPSLAVTPHLLKTLSLYIDRRGQLAVRRREEIALRLAGPLLERTSLPPETNPDLFLCALYQAFFMSGRSEALADIAGPVSSRPAAESPLPPISDGL